MIACARPSEDASIPGFDPADIPLEQRRIGPVLSMRARTDADRPFLTIGGRTYTFRETDRQARALARGLARRGLERQQYLAMMLPNCSEFVFAWFACALLGAANVPLNTALRGPMLDLPFKDSGARGLIIDRALVDAIGTLSEEVRGQLDWVAVWGGLEGLALPAGPKEYLDYRDLPLADGPDPERETDFRDVQTVFYTSGTTGPAKGVQTLNAHQFSTASGFVRAVGLTRDDVVYTPYPLFHAFAARLAVLPSLLAGAQVHVGARFSASRFWEQAAQCGATVAQITPGTSRILFERPPGPHDRAHRLRALFNTRADAAFEERFGVRLVEAFSMSETGLVIYTRWPERRPGSMGRVHEDWQAQLVDDKDLPVPAGQPGQLVVRPRLPYIMMQGYLNRPEATVAAFRNLWLHTGDIMRQDEDGYFYFVDRAKERIRRRGENISSYDIEQAAGAHPDVMECAALPHPARDGEDDVRLVAVKAADASLTAAQLADWLAERLPRSMVPRYVEFLPSLPRTQTDKVEKVRLIQAGLSAAAWDREAGGAAP
ncbi:ATP-dependent acyl-CoA ligase [Pigmentiphaga soli]|uniref:ATP-dependent acyl-CoA ligase n=1 Tax=Pigmentiphaga soli TaxID=1007095 RepID=A0ABP8GMD9_9BURK